MDEATKVVESGAHRYFSTTALAAYCTNAAPSPKCEVAEEWTVPSVWIAHHYMLYSGQQYRFIHWLLVLYFSLSLRAAVSIFAVAASAFRRCG